MIGSYLPLRSLRPKWWYNGHFAHGWTRVFNENMLDHNTIWPWSSGIAVGTAHKQLRLQQHIPVLQVCYIKHYEFSIHSLLLHCYIEFAETNITCYIHHYIINHSYLQNILYMSTLLLVYIYIDNFYIVCYVQCYYMTHDIKVQSWLCITTPWLYSS